MSNMERIVKFASRIDIDTTYGGCPVTKLFGTDKLTYSDHTPVPMGKEIDAIVERSGVAYKMRVEVTMRRARYDYEGKWGWSADKYGQGMLAFYHHDFDAMLEFAADYLEAHIDPLVGQYTVDEAHGRRLPTVVTCIKHRPIGRLVHISMDPDYSTYNLE